MTCFFSGFFEPYHIMKEVDGMCLFPPLEFVVVLPSNKKGEHFASWMALPCHPAATGMLCRKHVSIWVPENLVRSAQRFGFGWW